MENNSNPHWLIGTIVAVVALALTALYAHCTYGDWTCGLPGVECRKLTETPRP